MKAIYKGKNAEVWQIKKTGKFPEWVKEAFEKNYLYWLDDRLRILTVGFNPSLRKNLQFGVVGSVGGGFAGYGMYQIGYINDYIDITNHRVVSEKTFKKQYTVISLDD
ncbi:hypothetical protein ACVV62_08435 [Streptococcus pluranimalium]